MKNNILFMLITGSIILFSCGTANRANYTSSNFVNGIYYVPDQNEAQEYERSRAELNNLKNETSQYLNNRSKSLSYNSSQPTQTIFVGDTNVVDIAYNPYYNYAIQDDSTSYYTRLYKYNDPTYNINIEFDFPYSNWHDSWYRPYWNTLGTAWYNPYWGMYYSWWGPSYSWNYWHGGWYDPWYFGSWYNPWYAGGWYDPWWGPAWGPSWGYPYPPYPGPGFMPPPPHGGHYRDVYYGARNSTSSRPSYSANHGGTNRGSGSYTRRAPSMSQIRGNRDNMSAGVAQRPNNIHNQSNTAPQNGTSYTRGTAYKRGGNTTHNGAIYNNNAANAGTNNNSGNVTLSNNKSTTPAQGNSMYRRSSVQRSSQNTSTKSTNSSVQYNNNSQRSNNNSNYYRNNNSNYNRSSSSYSSGSNHNSSGSSYNRSSGSSYRR